MRVMVNSARLSFIALAAGLLCLSLFARTEDNPGSRPVASDDHSIPLRKDLLSPQPTALSFGILPIGKNPSRILEYGPSVRGWKGIILYSGYLPTDSLDFHAARAVKYDPIIAALNRNDIATGNWSRVRMQVDFGKRNGANWFYVDDGLSGNTGTDSTDISKTEIDSVALLVHAYPRHPLATAEYSERSMRSQVHWHDSVDIIMPYKYDFNAAQLDTFFSFVRDRYPGKGLVPFLGYHADKDLNGDGTIDAYFFQTGTPGSGHIEVANKYATMSLIFYYVWFGDMRYADDLTCYLQQYYQLGPGHCP